MLYKVALTFESVDEILKFDHSNKSYWAVTFCDAVYYAVQGGPIFWVCGWNPKVWPFKWKLLSSTFMWYCVFCCTRWLKILLSVDEKVWPLTEWRQQSKSCVAVFFSFCQREVFRRFGTWLRYKVNQYSFNILMVAFWYRYRLLYFLFKSPTMAIFPFYLPDRARCSFAFQMVSN